MIGYRQTLLVFLLMMLSGAAIAQNNTNSPYTRYGYGQLADQGSGNSKAMGGIAYGLRDKYQVNFANPASYTAIDSLTLFFDGGISLQNTNFSNGTIKQNAKNSSFDYITMQFRLGKWAAMSLGLLPYSNVGYSMAEYKEDTDYPSQSSALQYYGDGGLHQLYLGAGFKVLKNLSVGANISYFWGDITHTRAITFPGNSSTLPLTTITGTSIQSYKLDIGAQYTQVFGKKHEATLGIVFSPGHDLNNDSYVEDRLGNEKTGTTVNNRDTVAAFGSPMSLGVGFSYVYDKRLTVGADFTFQKWSSVTYMNEKNAFCNRTKIAVGAEFSSKPYGKELLGTCKISFGSLLFPTLL